MGKDWESAEHVAKIGLSIMHVLAEEFHIEAGNGDAKDFGKMIKLSQAVGYQSQLFSALQKSHEFSRRLQAVEKAASRVTPEEMAMEFNPVVMAENQMLDDQKRI